MRTATMKAIDVIKTALPQITDAERAELLKLLQADNAPCKRLGHNFKAVKVDSPEWWKSKQTVLICCRCGVRAAT
jgi:hypothetical protein